MGDEYKPRPSTVKRWEKKWKAAARREQCARSSKWRKSWLRQDLAGDLRLSLQFRGNQYFAGSAIAAVRWARRIKLISARQCDILSKLAICGKVKK